MTPLAFLLERCGLSIREAADFLDVRVDTIKSWSSGRNRTPPAVIAELRVLYRRIERAAAEELAVMPDAPPDVITEIGIVTSDAEARTIGWPCVGAHAAVIGLIVARSNGHVLIVPRGSPPANAVQIEPPTG